MLCPLDVFSKCLFLLKKAYPQIIVEDPPDLPLTDELVKQSYEAPRPQGGASRKGNLIYYIVPLYPVYLSTAGRQDGACGALAGQEQCD
jgi:hypothetical protein